MERIFRVFRTGDRVLQTQVMVSVEHLRVTDGSQVFIELMSDKIEPVQLDDSVKTVYTDEIELLEINVYKNDYAKIGCKNLELMKKIYYYDIYSLVNSKFIEFHTLVELTQCKFQVRVKLVFSEKLKKKIKQQRVKPVNPLSSWYSCFQVCNRCSEVNLN